MALGPRDRDENRLTRIRQAEEAIDQAIRVDPAPEMGDPVIQEVVARLPAAISHFEWEAFLRPLYLQRDGEPLWDTAEMAFNAEQGQTFVKLTYNPVVAVQVSSPSDPTVMAVSGIKAGSKADVTIVRGKR